MKNYRLVGDKEKFRKEFGRLVSVEEINGDVITVGDRCTLELVRNGVIPKLAIIDFKEQREPLGDEFKELKYNAYVLHVFNPPGYITDHLVGAVEKALEKTPARIEVKGEEDLAAVVVMQKAPIGSKLVYGIKDKGMMLVEINEEARNIANDLMNEMEEIEWN